MPALKTGERLIRVEPGDTASQLAERYKISYSALIRRNGLKNPDRIYVGQRLVLPSGSEVTAPARRTVVIPEQSNRPAARARSEKTHVVARSFALFPVPKSKPGTTKRRTSPKPAAAPAPKRIETPAPKRTQVAETPPPRRGFRWPVSGPILLGYGPKAGGLYNDGVNIGANKGTPVRAADSGVVTYVGNELRGFGNLTLIKHGDGYITAYAHTAKPKVQRGDKVKRGPVISTVDSSGAVDRPQLHFEIRKGLKARNPMKYLPDPAKIAGS